MQMSVKSSECFESKDASSPSGRARGCQPRSGEHESGLRILSADYTIRAQTVQKYWVDVSVVVDCANSHGAARSGLDGWKINFELEYGTEMIKMWNAEMSQSGNFFTATHHKFCRPVNRSKAVLYFGFEAKPPSSSTAPYFPSTVVVNGQVTRVCGCLARDLADCSLDRFHPESPSPPPKREESQDEDYQESQEPRNRSEPSDFSLDCEPASLSRSSCISPVTVVAESHSPVRETSCDPAARCHDHEEDNDVLSARETPSPSLMSSTGTQFFRNLIPHQSLTPSMRDAFDAHSPSPTNLDLQSSSRKRKTPDEGFDEDRPAFKVPRTLEIDYYRRSQALKNRKWTHMDYLDTCFDSREEVILDHVLDRDSIVLEPNMFPYDCPKGVTHWTLWSKKWLEQEDIDKFVNNWLKVNLPDALEWNHDDNMADGLSINLFHLHVYIKCPA
mmetsp:Transcript_22066/g.34601  ORF Transcript_22066/g.34601 Transcript_22066/m.34601 type:complete len:445 (-) Transcript_22066:86-1420(-)|eukprot:CAMPEP_0184309920 /NCGR_PEP_ID=MMETSP1049-20130417/21225_1 /TAXON_ID=77928 /ORGANISM="Proteomonas sulcata, Strain CCMP704" /LENGTH=444 /DNA_ID=CAMNT_0026623201 /DNA_START=250 /DNA_END=1584 /DNA_ORIENTATION=+